MPHSDSVSAARAGWNIEITDLRLVNIVKQCRDLHGYLLFEYFNECKEICAVGSADVNRYIQEAAREEFTAKDFRTWPGPILAARELTSEGPCSSKTAIKRRVASAVCRVARQLGNRPATCRKYYIYPAIIDAYSDGFLFSTMERGVEQDRSCSGLGLRPEEYSLMVIVARHQEQCVRTLRSSAA